jgi:WD40 repeat protein
MKKFILDQSMLSKQIYRISVKNSFYSNNFNSLVITGSADKSIKILDIIGGFKEFRTLRTSDAVFSLETLYNLTVAGCGDGNLLVFDNDVGDCLYGY